MRTRLVIPAAILVAAAYVKGRQDAHLFTPSGSRPAAPGPTADDIRVAEAGAADAWELGLADAEVAATSAYAPPAPAAAEPVVAFEPEPEPETVAAPPALATIPPAALRALQTFTPAPSRVAVPRPPVRPERPAVAELDPALLSEWLAAPAGAAARIDDSGRFALGGWAAQAGHMALCGVTFRNRLEIPADVARIRLRIDASENIAPGGLVVLADAGFAPDIEGFTLLLAAAGPGAFAASGRYELLSADAR